MAENSVLTRFAAAWQLAIARRAPACLFILILAVVAANASAADLLNGVPTAIREPECISNPNGTIFVDIAAPPRQYALVVRHMDDDAISTPANYDFGSFQGQPMTNFHPPAPVGIWQRAKMDSDPNHTSAVQVHCFDAGLFVNTWQFKRQDLIDEGPHAAYAYTFSDYPRIFDGNPNTDFVLQTELEVPWFYRPSGVAGAVVYLQARFLDTTSGKLFQIIWLLFGNEGVDYVASANYARGDSLFISTPLVSNDILTRSPYSAQPSKLPWTGLRFFRAQISPANFSNAIGLLNTFCRSQVDIADCTELPGTGGALSGNPVDYVITEMSVISELFNADQDANGISVGVHLRGFGAYNFR